MNLRWIVLLIICVIISCGERESSLLQQSSFHYNQPNNITSLDPAFARSMNNNWAVHHLYSKLVRLDSAMNIIPDIAHSWDVDTAGLEYTFYLKNDVFFHQHGLWEGKKRRLISEDVAYSYGRITDDKVGSPGSWIFKGRLNGDAPFSTPNDSTFILRLKEPFPAMMSILTMEYCGIVASEVVEFYGGNFRSNPIGTGPFQIMKWKENQGLFLEKNPLYSIWNSELPKLDKLRISFIRDRKTALLELLSGNIDFISGYDVTYDALLLNKNHELLTRHQKSMNLVKSPFLNMEYLGINMSKANEELSPLADKSFRKALNFGINRELMLSSVNGGIGSPAQQGFIPIGLPSYDGNRRGYSYNLDSAIYWLNQSGYDGENIILHTNKDYLEKCLFVSHMWENIGIHVKVELIESSMLRDMMRNGETLFFRGSWIADYPDGESFLTVFYGKNPTPPNYTQFRNQQFDQIYEDALATVDPLKRTKKYEKADKILIEEAPIVFLYYDETFKLVGKDVLGLRNNALNLMETEWIHKKN